MLSDAAQKLIPIIYDTPFRPEAWQSFCDAYYKLTDSPVQLAGFDIVSRNNLGLLASGYSENYNKSYETYYAGLNPFLRMNVTMQPGDVGMSSQALPLEELRKTEFYNDWLAPQDGLIGGSAMMIYRSNTALLAISSAVYERHQEKAYHLINGLLSQLAQHFQKAASMARSLGDLDCSRDPSLAMMERFPQPIFCLDHDGLVIWQNTCGENFLTKTQLLKVTGKMLSSRQPDLADWLALISKSASKPTNSVPSAKAFDCIINGHGVLHWYPAPQSAGQQIFPANLWQKPPAGFVIVTRTASFETKHNVGAVAQALGFTPAETGLAEAVMRGISLNEYADSLQLSRHTIRNQMRALLVKSKSRNQQEFIITMNHLASPFGGESFFNS